MRNVILSLLLLLIFMRCEKFAMDRKYSMYLKNNTHDTIVYLTGENVNPGPLIYPDSSLPLTEIPDYANNIEPLESKDLFVGSVKISTIVNNLPADTLSVYIFHKDSLNNNSWEEIRNNYKILKRYDLSLQDLEDLGYRVNYPPDAKMSRVRMYPPFK